MVILKNKERERERVSHLIIFISDRESQRENERLREEKRETERS